MVELNDAKKGDCNFVYKLRTLKEDKENYRSRDEISIEQHKIFWEINYKKYKMIKFKNEVIGYCGLVNGDYRFAVIPDYRGMGIGKKAVELCRDMIGDNKIFVMRENIASIKCFTHNGYEVVGESSNFLIMQK